jgi:hypothetical protein
LSKNPKFVQDEGKARIMTAVCAEHHRSPTSRGKANLLEVRVSESHHKDNKLAVTALTDFKPGAVSLFPVSHAVLSRPTNSDLKGIPPSSQLLCVASGYDFFSGAVRVHAASVTDVLKTDAAVDAVKDEDWIAPYWCVASTHEEAEANMVIEEFVSKAVDGTVTIPRMTNARAIDAKDVLKFYMPHGGSHRYPVAKRQRAA